MLFTLILVLVIILFFIIRNKDCAWYVKLTRICILLVTGILLGLLMVSV